jgi:hypothetical protein
MRAWRRMLWACRPCSRAHHRTCQDTVEIPCKIPLRYQIPCKIPLKYHATLFISTCAFKLSLSLSLSDATHAHSGAPATHTITQPQGGNSVKGGERGGGGGGFVEKKRGGVGGGGGKRERGRETHL